MEQRVDQTSQTSANYKLQAECRLAKVRGSTKHFLSAIKLPQLQDQAA